MKTTIRQNTFETNSSSAHSLSIMTQEMYDDFVNNDKLYLFFREVHYSASEPHPEDNYRQTYYLEDIDSIPDDIKQDAQFAILLQEKDVNELIYGLTGYWNETGELFDFETRHDCNVLTYKEMSEYYNRKGDCPRYIEVPGMPGAYGLEFIQEEHGIGNWWDFD